MTRKRKGQTRLPRLTVPAMSRQELQRFSTAAEVVVAVAHDLAELVHQLGPMVDRLEKRSAAARKVNDTRRNGAGESPSPTA